jgi:ABC-type glutathione transport system ATPase component
LRASATTIIFAPGSKQLTLNGNASLQQGGNTIRSEQILYDVAARQIRADGKQDRVRMEFDVQEKPVVDDCLRDGRSMSNSSLQGLKLQKRYRDKVAVDDVSLSVERGEVIGLLGPNGAGKTTSFYLLVGLLRCDAGQGDVER